MRTGNWFELGFHNCTVEDPVMQVFEDGGAPLLRTAEMDAPPPHHNDRCGTSGPHYAFTRGEFYCVVCGDTILRLYNDVGVVY